MPLSAWTFDRGATQGRIAPAAGGAPEGAYLFALGSDLPGVQQELAIGDYHEVHQQVDLTGVQLIRFRGSARGAAAAPAGTAWRASLRIDGTEVYGWLLPAGREVGLRDRAFNVSKLSAGNHDVAFRLTLVAA